MAKKLQKEKLGKSMLERKLERKNKKKSLKILLGGSSPFKLLCTHHSLRASMEK
jgi:hypothetical protein